MPRKRKGPWLRESDNCYYTTIGKKLHKLGSADDPWEDIEHAYGVLLASLKTKVKRTFWTVAALADEFLEWNKNNQAERTYDWYKRYLDPFIAEIGNVLGIENLKPYMVSNWLDSRYKNCSENTRHGAARAVTRLCNWSVKQGHILKSPIKEFEKPTPEARDTSITPEQFAAILEVALPHIKQLLLFAWNTGVRPQELRIIEGRHVHGRTVTLDRKQSKGKRSKRVIYLNDRALEIVNRLKDNEGPLFTTLRGKPWTRETLNNLFRTLREKSGIEDFCPYTLRHSYATEMLKAGTPTAVLADLMGTSEAMIAKTYQHVARDSDFMLRAVQCGGTVPAVVVTSLPTVGGTGQAVPL